MATVHLIDDDESMRTALGRLLSAAGYTVRTYAAAGDYLVPAPDDDPSCLVLDLQLPGVSGLELQAALPHHPDYDRPIIFLSGTADVRSSVQAMRAGASEFLTKPIQREALLAAVENAVGRDVAQRERRRRARNARGRLESLGPRERKVLDGIVEGKLHKQMAAELGVSERTIKVDRARVMKQLGVRSLADLLKVLGEAARAPVAGAPVAPETAPPGGHAQAPAHHAQTAAQEGAPLVLGVAATSGLLALAAVARSVAGATPGGAGIDPEALAALRRMAGFVGTLPAFAIRGRTSTELVLDDGQKIRIDSALAVQVHAPGRVHVDVVVDRKTRLAGFDGHALAFQGRPARGAAQVLPEESLHALVERLGAGCGIDMAVRELLALAAGAGDAPPGGAAERGLESALVIGPAMIRGTPCEQYAFRRPALDWQVWIQRGARPLPRRIALTVTDDPARPQHCVDLEWTVESRLPAGGAHGVAALETP
jgi:FixJ family two-component response regulator